MAYRIGDFSMITRLSVKTLRYYHEIGLLEPCRIDADSGYRWYDEAAVSRAATINLLKELTFSLDEIKGILARAQDDSDLSEPIRAKLRELDQRIAHYRGLRNQLAVVLHEAGAKGTQGETMKTTENPSIEILPELKIASFRYQGRYDQIGPWFGKLFKLYGRWASGSCLALYHDTDYREDDADIEAALALRPDSPALPREGAAIRVLPGVRVAQILHRGPYEQLGESYRRLFEFTEAQGLKTRTPSREIYLKGPGMILPRSPKRYLTLLQLPLAD